MLFRAIINNEGDDLTKVVKIVLIGGGNPVVVQSIL